MYAQNTTGGSSINKQSELSEGHPIESIRVITRGDILHIAPNSPHLLKPWRFVAIFMLEYGMWRTLRLRPDAPFLFEL